MTWQISFSKGVIKFLDRSSEINEKEVVSLLKKALNRLINNSLENVDLKKLKGDWLGFYRVRRGDLRIIFEINFEKHELHAEKIDFRGSVY